MPPAPLSGTLDEPCRSMSTRAGVPGGASCCVGKRLALMLSETSAPEARILSAADIADERNLPKQPDSLNRELSCALRV